jgi:uncharacterized membrane-anchored protein
MLVAGPGPTATAQSLPAPAPGIQAEVAAALEAAFEAGRVGPAVIALLDQGRLALPVGFRFVPEAPAARLLRAMGNAPGRSLVGLVLPDDDEKWMAIISFARVGYVRDDEAKDWTIDGLLETLRAATEQSNADRVRSGFPAVEVAGWIEPPAYAPTKRHLIWSAHLRRKGGEAAGHAGSVNYNTFALGREGFFELNLVAPPSVIGEKKSRAHALLDALSFHPGRRYEDFRAATDKVADIGLARLVGGQRRQP